MWGSLLHEHLVLSISTFVILVILCEVLSKSWKCKLRKKENMQSFGYMCKCEVEWGEHMIEKERIILISTDCNEIMSHRDHAEVAKDM